MRYDTDGTCCSNNFRKLGHGEELERAIQLAKHAADVKVTWLGFTGPSKAIALDDLAWMLKTRFDLMGSLEDLNESIRLLQESYVLIAVNKEAFLTNMSERFVSRFEQTGLREDLDTAIDSAAQALDINFGRALSRRSKLTGSGDDLERAIKAFEKVIRLMSTKDQFRPLAMLNLSVELHSRFERSNSMTDLDESVKWATDAFRDSHASGNAHTRHLISGALSQGCKTSVWTELGPTDQPILDRTEPNR